MPVVLAIILVLFAIVISVAIVGRESRTHDAKAVRYAFDVDSAVRWIGDQLPDEMQATVSYDEVRHIVEWNLEFMKSRGVVENGHKPVQTGPVIVGGAESAGYIMGKAAAAGIEVPVEVIHTVLEAQIAYLEAIGAVGPKADGEL